MFFVIVAFVFTVAMTVTYWYVYDLLLIDSHIGFIQLLKLNWQNFVLKKKMYFNIVVVCDN